MPKDWQGNVRYLLKLLFRWRLNCTEIAQASDRRAVFSNHSPQTNTYCQLAEGALSSRCLRLCISTLYRKCFPHLRAHQKSRFSTLFSFTKLVVKKSRRKRFVSSDISDELLGSFHHPYASIAQSEGVQQQATRVSPQTADLLFLLPHHMTTRHLSEFFFTS